MLQDSRFGELRVGVWLRPDNLRLDLGAEIRSCVRVLHSYDDAPAELARQLWDLPGWADAAGRLLDEMAVISKVADIPGRFVVAAAMVRHLLADPVLPGELLPDGWPGDRLRACYNEFAAELAARRDHTELMEAK